MGLELYWDGPSYQFSWRSWLLGTLDGIMVHIGLLYEDGPDGTRVLQGKDEGSDDSGH